MKIEIVPLTQESTVQLKGQGAGFSPGVLSGTGRKKQL